MRFNIMIFSLGISLLYAAAPALAAQDLGQTAEKYQIVSDQLIEKGTQALADNDLGGAQLLFEKALVADPSSVGAYIGLGRTYEGLERTGSSLRFYRKALEIDPNDLQALELQSLAFLTRDLVDRAVMNRERLARLCQHGCAELETVETAIELWHMDRAGGNKVADNSTAKK